MSVAREFYEAQFRGPSYAQGMEARSEAPALARFVGDHHLTDKRVLEIGSGRGAFQGLSTRWVGIDIAVSAGAAIARPFAVASAAALPFVSESFDGLWSVTVLEHVPDPAQALAEIARVLRPGGLAFLAPAWHCRPWTASGIHLRPWSELRFAERLVRLTIPLREALWFRAALVLPLRLVRELGLALLPGRATRFRYGRLRPNYETFLCADSDACNSMDPHEMLVWFLSRGWSSPSHSGAFDRLRVRHGAILVRKPSA